MQVWTKKTTTGTMNKTIIALVSLVALACTCAYGQNLECKYTAVMKIPEDFVEIEDESTRNLVLSQLSKRVENFSMKVSNGKYLFETLLEEKSNTNIMVVGGAGTTIYMDMNEKVTVSQENILDRTFLIREELEEYEWELVPETKEILEMTCTKAVLKSDTDIVAWFAPEIPVSFGPLGYYGLPGLIVELETPYNQYVLHEINLHRDALQIEAPRKGKETSREEFNALRKKKQEELGAQGSESGIKVKVITM